MLGKFLKLIGLDKPFDESRRAAITTVGKAALYPVLNSVVPEVLSETQYSDDELAIAERLYALGQEIRNLNNLEFNLSFRELIDNSVSGKDTQPTISRLLENRDKIDNCCTEFEHLAKIAASNPKLIGWNKAFFPGGKEKISITESGATITELSIDDLVKIKKPKSGQVIPYVYKDVSIRDFAGSRETLLKVIQGATESGEYVNAKIKEIKNKLQVAKHKESNTAISRYSLCHTGECEQFSFEQDSKSWREKLKQEHDEYIGRH